jgi:hypothetical protein
MIGSQLALPRRDWCRCLSWCRSRRLSYPVALGHCVATLPEWGGRFRLSLLDRPGLYLRQEPDDLLFRKPRLLHVRFPFGNRTLLSFQWH